MGGNDALNGENASAVGGMMCQEEEALLMKMKIIILRDTSLLENRSMNFWDQLLNGVLLLQIFSHGVAYQRITKPLAKNICEQGWKVI